MPLHVESFSSCALLDKWETLLRTCETRGKERIVSLRKKRKCGGLRQMRMIIILSHFHSRVDVVLRFASCSWSVYFRVSFLEMCVIQSKTCLIWLSFVVCCYRTPRMLLNTYAQPCKTGMTTMEFYCDILLILFDFFCIF